MLAAVVLVSDIIYLDNADTVCAAEEPSLFLEPIGYSIPVLTFIWYIIIGLGELHTLVQNGGRGRLIMIKNRDATGSDYGTHIMCSTRICSNVRHAHSAVKTKDGKGHGRLDRA